MCQRNDSVLIVTLNRPAVRNCVDRPTAAALAAAFRAFEADDRLKVASLTGAGAHFCAGADLNAVASGDAERANRVDAAGDGPMGPTRLQLTKPVIAAINGACGGIGATLTLPMDVRFASDDARIGFVFGRVGIVLEACSSWFLPRIVGMSRALEWCYRARVMSAQEALEGGLLRELVPADRLLAHAIEYARSLVAVSSPVSIAMTRQLLLRNSGAAHPAEAHKAESLTLLHALAHDASEGVRAFHEKRAPKFTSSPSRDLPPFYADWVAGRRGPADPG